MTEELSAQQADICHAAAGRDAPEDAPHAALQVHQRQHSGNTARKWARRAAKRRIFQPRYVTLSSVKSRHDLTVVDRRLAIVSMKGMAATLFINHRHILFGPAGAIERFWDKFRKVKPPHPIFPECTADELRYVFHFPCMGTRDRGWRRLRRSCSAGTQS